MSLRKALTKLAEESSELSAAASRLNHRGHKNMALWKDLDKQKREVLRAWRALNEWIEWV